MSSISSGTAQVMTWLGLHKTYPLLIAIAYYQALPHFFLTPFHVGIRKSHLCPSQMKGSWFTTTALLFRAIPFACAFHVPTANTCKSIESFKRFSNFCFPFYIDLLYDSIPVYRYSVMGQQRLYSRRYRRGGYYAVYLWLKSLFPLNTSILKHRASLLDYFRVIHISLDLMSLPYRCWHCLCTVVEKYRTSPNI